MQPFDCLDAKTEIYGPHILEASAGTGKTFAIEHLFVRFLQEVDISEILVVTFTRKATRELKGRIFQNIEKALLDLKKEKSFSFDYLHSFKRNEGGIDRLSEGLFSFDQSQIYTIHGFCQRMLSEHFLQAGTYLQPDSSESVVKEKLLIHIQENLSFLGFHPHQFQTLLRKLGGIDTLCEKLLYEYPKTPIEIKTCAEVLELLNEKLLLMPDFFEKDIEECLAFFPSYKKTGFSDYESFALQLEKLFSVLGKKLCSEEEFGFFIKTKLSLLCFLDPQNLKKNKEPHHFSSLTWAQKEILPLIEEAVDANSLFSSLYRTLFPTIDKIHEKEGFFPPDRILDKMEKMVFQEEFYHEVRKRYKVLIIDEFQDTDPIQWSIFENLFLKEPYLKALYLVGDPKQSIYRFRNADLYTYLRAQEKVGTSALFHLSSNFRSHESLVSSLNALFSPPFAKKWLTLPKTDSHLNYLPVEAKAKQEGLDDHLAPLHFFVAEEHAKRTVPSKETEGKKLFPFIYNEIIRLKKEGYQDKDFAILVKDRYQAARVKEYLEKRGLCTLCHTTNDLRQSSIYTALKDFFEMIIFFPNDSMMKKVLLGPFFQLSFEELLSFEKSDFYSSIYKNFSALKDVLEKEGLSSFFSFLFTTRFFEEEKTIIDQICKKDLNLFYEFIQLIELIMDLYEGPCENLFLLFEEIEKLSLSEEERLKLQATNLENAVEIITIHMSKGLEYTIVFALGLASRVNPDPTLSEQELKELDAEKMRQLYVALTRAKKRVYVPYIIDLSKKMLSLGQRASIEIFLQKASGLEYLDQHSLKSVLQKINKEVSLSYLEEKIIQTIGVRKLFSYSYENRSLNISSEKIFSFSSLLIKGSYLEKDEKEPFQSLSSVEVPLVGLLEEPPAGPQTGTFLHEVLEKVLLNPYLREDQELFSLIKEKSVKTDLQKHDKALFQMVKNALYLPLFEKESLSIQSLSNDHMHVEMDFFYPLRKEGKIQDYLKGIIDLAFYHDGKYYLVDWKSNYLEKGYNFKAMQETVIEHEYDLQASIYVEAFRRFIENVEKKSFENVFGGAYLIFLRGIGVESDSKTGIYQFDQKQLKGENEIYAVLSDRK